MSIGRGLLLLSHVEVPALGAARSWDLRDDVDHIRGGPQGKTVRLAPLGFICFGWRIASNVIAFDFDAASENFRLVRSTVRGRFKTRASSSADLSTARPIKTLLASPASALEPARTTATLHAMPTLAVPCSVQHPPAPETRAGDRELAPYARETFFVTDTQPRHRLRVGSRLFPFIPAPSGGTAERLPTGGSAPLSSALPGVLASALRAPFPRRAGPPPNPSAFTSSHPLPPALDGRQPASTAATRACPP